MAVATIRYCTSESDASVFWDTHRAQAVHEIPIPEGFPHRILSSSAWDPQTILSNPSEWVLQLNEEEVHQLEVAMRNLGDCQATPSSISPQTFRLPDALRRRLRDISTTLHHGVGLVVLKGLDSSRYTQDENAKLFAGISCHIASQRGFLDWDREVVLGHMINARKTATDGRQKTPGFTNSALAFHTDSCEILALYALEFPEHGGSPLIASQHQLYNELAASHPDVLQTLANDWLIDTFQDYKVHPPKSMPFLHQQNSGETAIFRLSRFPITGFEAKTRNPALPPPTAAQVKALDTVQFLAKANSIAVPMEKGDMMFVNNMTLMHGRETYEDDGKDSTVKRYLLKMFLRDPEQSYHIPESLQSDWFQVHGSNRPDGSRVESWCPHYRPGLEEGMVENG